MAAVLNRTTKEYRPSANTPDFPVAEWIINPDLTAVAGQPIKYWIITGDVVTLASPAQQAVIDTAIATQRRNANRDQASGAADDPAAVGMQNRSIIEVFNQRDNFLTNRIVQLQDAMDAMKASTGAIQNLRDAIPATFLPTATRPKGDAIQDYKDEINSGGADN